VFAQRWLHRLPLPFGAKDHDAGYWREVSMRQVEVSRTIVFDAPRHARGFFEALIADNLDIGRPHNVEIIFARKIRRDTKGVFRTAIDRRDNGGVLVNVFYKHSRIKQYLKDGRAMRIETVVNAPRDLGCNARLPGSITPSGSTSRHHDLAATSAFAHCRPARGPSARWRSRRTGSAWTGIARILSWLTLAAMGIEGGVAIGAAAAAGSAALPGSGLDRGIEAMASIIVIRRSPGPGWPVPHPSGAPSSWWLLASSCSPPVGSSRHRCPQPHGSDPGPTGLAWLGAMDEPATYLSHIDFSAVLSGALPDRPDLAASPNDLAVTCSGVGEAPRLVNRVSEAK